MSVDKFKFVSPGVQLAEIDESGIPALPERMGPMVIGRFKKGPGNRPVKVESYKEFAQLFGEPAAGNASGDIWRSGELTAPTYAAYAVKAWLKNNSPCTVYRVLGEEAGNAETGQSARAGWRTSGTFANADISSSAGGAYGLFIMPNPDSYPSSNATASITFSDTGSVGSVVTIISADGTSISFTSTDAATDASSNLWNTGSGTSDAATQLLSVITHSSGHAGRITGNTDGATVHLTQSTGGALGNRDITEDETNAAALGFGGGVSNIVTGTLAAVWYVEDGAVVLTGSSRDGTNRQAAGALIKSDGGLKFTAKIVQGGVAESDVTKTATFNFDRNSDLFIRKVFNTNPTRTNSQINSSADNYWLGETFESNLISTENSKMAVTGSSVTETGDHLGVILALDGTQGGSNVEWADHQQQATAARTGWFFSQDNRGETTASFDPTAHTDSLFRIHALDSGAQANRDYKVSITDIKVPTDNFNKFGTFSLEVRSATDIDNKPAVLERFSGMNLDPKSSNYIGRVIGDRNYTYDEENKRIIEHGENDNRSSYIRVEVSDLVAAGDANGKNPFGVFGPAVVKTHEITDAVTGTIISVGSGSTNALPTQTMIDGHAADELLYTSYAMTASVEWPTSRLRVSSSEGSLVQASQAYFGYQSNIAGSRRFNKANLDLHRVTPQAFDQSTVSAGDTLRQYSWVFTLDDVQENSSDTNHAVWVSGSRASGDSFTAVSASASEPYVLTKGFDQFTSPMFGGADGYDVTEQDNFRNSKMGSSPTEINNSAYYSLKKAIDVCADADFLEYDLLAVPGITNDTLNTQLINTCEDRADALAVVDLEGGYLPPHERSESETDSSVLGSVTTTVNNLKDMNINSSYGCAFYPWVKIRDAASDSLLYVPPSVVALGTFSSSQRKSAVWFAPAGFTRGGLSEGSAGLPVLGVRQRLTSTERDKLYDANINPIASFPAEGLVIFGQKTLQVTPSALDRINVRRLMIFVKKEISRIASRVLFDQNVQATWDRFTGQVVPFLEGVQAGLGLSDFKVVLDDTTTTPDLVDRNILYAKIFLKPARAIEFIALDFIITRSGASFED